MLGIQSKHYFHKYKGTICANIVRYSHYNDVLMSVSNHRYLDYLSNRLFRRRSKKTSKFRVPGLCEGIHWSPVDSPHKGPATRKMFPFDDVIMMQTSYSVMMKKFTPLSRENIILEVLHRPWYQRVYFLARIVPFFTLWMLLLIWKFDKQLFMIISLEY